MRRGGGQKAMFKRAMMNGSSLVRKLTRPMVTCVPLPPNCCFAGSKMVGTKLLQKLSGLRSFKKTGISNQMDGTEDHLLDMDSDEDPFYGFDAADVADVQMFAENQRSNLDGAVISEDSKPEDSAHESESDESIMTE